MVIKLDKYDLQTALEAYDVHFSVDACDYILEYYDIHGGPDLTFDDDMVSDITSTFLEYESIDKILETENKYADIYMDLYFDAKREYATNNNIEDYDDVQEYDLNMNELNKKFKNILISKYDFDELDNGSLITTGIIINK